MKTLRAAEFKAKCLSVMEEVRQKREPVLITKRGKPLAKLVPPDQKSNDLIGRLSGVIRITGDIESPIEPPEAWESLR
jgi:prevent-host-death family protein